MSLSLHELLQRHIKKMVSGIGGNEKGNIHPLIMQEVERCIISSVLVETNNNYFRTAKILGISRSTLYRKIQYLKIE
jgi:DNA-binding protein Fis